MCRSLIHCYKKPYTHAWQILLQSMFTAKIQKIPNTHKKVSPFFHAVSNMTATTIAAAKGLYPF